MIAKDNDTDNDDENNAQRPVTNSVIVILQIINVFTNNICRMNITGFLMGYHSHRPC